MRVRQVFIYEIMWWGSTLSASRSQLSYTPILHLQRHLLYHILFLLSTLFYGGKMFFQKNKKIFKKPIDNLLNFVIMKL